MGPLEWVLNTPSHHRVHHGRNPYCIDKNYGNEIIIVSSTTISNMSLDSGYANYLGQNVW